MSDLLGKIKTYLLYRTRWLLDKTNEDNSSKLSNGKENMLKNKKGFTLLELIVVIVVAGLLAAIAIPSFNNVKVSAKKQAGYQEANAFAKEVTALAAFTQEDDASDYTDEAITDIGGGASYSTAGVFEATNGVQHNITISGDTARVGTIVDGSWN